MNKSKINFWIINKRFIGLLSFSGSLATECVLFKKSNVKLDLLLLI